MTACHDPGNGQGICIKQDVLDTLAEDSAALKLASHGTVTAIAGMRSDVQGVRAELSGVRTEQRQTKQLVQRLVDNIELGNVRVVSDPTLDRPRIPEVSIPDWEPDEPTLSGREPEMAATLWRARAVEGNEKVTELKVALERALATIAATEAERKRHSDHVEKAAKRTWTKWEKIGGIIVAIIAALGSGTLLAQLLH